MTAAEPHLFQDRVRYADTDAGGVVWHGTYLRFAEAARIEMLRDAGAQVRPIVPESPYLFVVRKAEMEFLSPARLDELLTVRSRCLEIGGASCLIEQRICNIDRDLVTILVRLVCVDEGFKPARIPADIRAILAQTAPQTGD